jgi:hypothetical protein
MSAGARYRRIARKHMRAGAKTGCGGIILTHDFSGLAPNELRRGTANDLGGYQPGVGSDFCRLMAGAKSMQNFVSNLPDHC